MEHGNILWNRKRLKIWERIMYIFFHILWENVLRIIIQMQEELLLA